MAAEQQRDAALQRGSDNRAREPRGFGEHTRGLPGEYAHEQGWGLDEEERRRLETGGPQDTDGGNNYNYSAQDFGDEPVNMARVDGDAAEEQAARRALGLDQQPGSSSDKETK